MAKLNDMYQEWLGMMRRGGSYMPINPLYHIIWMERVFGYSYQTCRKIFRMFMSRLKGGY